MYLRTTTVAILAMGLVAPALAQSTQHSMPTHHSQALQKVAMMRESTVAVGGSAMYPSRTIVQNALNSKDHTTLVAAVKAAGLVGALSSPGPFTVFAPTNEAFADLPAGTVQTLLKPANKDMLTKILEYHVVPGDYNTTKLRAMVIRDGGKAELKTLEGGMLTVGMNGSSNMTVTDDKGNVADITIADVTQKNGVIQVIDKVLTP